ncbi:MAG: TRAP transporter permease, partial [Rhodospirillales bacterium]|nr:TRAP transporter permease [Rhodospirillales bacterium]
GVQRTLTGWQRHVFYWAAAAFTAFHLYVLNVHPIDPWLFRTIHVGVGSAIGFAIFSASPRSRDSITWLDWLLMAASIGCVVYIADNLEGLLFRAGVLPTFWDMILGIVGTLLVLEITRRTAGLALPIIAFVFVAYAFIGPWLPGVLHHSGASVDGFFSYIYSMQGVFGPTTAVSSTYIILFIAFSAFLNVSKVGTYFVDFAFAIAGWAKGGPAKVAVLSSGLMGTINGTSAGNVVATGTFTIPLMKKVGYPAKSAGAIEAAASTGGQIMPPVMGAGAFIMAEITGIPYTEIMIAAIIPAALYFISVYFMVDHEATKLNMVGLPRSELPQFSVMIKKAYLFAPLVVLVWALIDGYSVIRAGTLGLITALVTSWFYKEGRMGPRQVIRALNEGAIGTIQLIAVCACAGIIVGVIALTGIGGRFSSMLLTVAGQSQFLALVFAMLIAIVLGMGMPTTAAYAVAASVVGPGLIQLGIEPLIAHMFIFYYAVISAITPPVALAAYAGAAIAGSDPMRTSVVAFKYGLAAFIVPFMFFYSPGLLMQGDVLPILRMLVTATVGVFLLASALQGWYFGRAPLVLRLGVFVGALLLIEGGFYTDLSGLGVAVLAWGYQRVVMRRSAAA